MYYHILTGGNVGNVLSNLLRTEELLKSNAGQIKNASWIYKTSAWGEENQSFFLNRVLILESPFKPDSLIEITQKIERIIGRQKTYKWGPREIDIDILCCENKVFKSDKLTIPHPEILNRRFTLVPFNEISPEYVLPVIEISISKALDLCEDNSPVEKYCNPLNWQNA